MLKPVCSCTAQGSLRDMESRLLEQVVDAGVRKLHRLSRQGQVKRMARWGLALGDLCEKSGHVARAISIWSETLSLAFCIDYDWVDTPINPVYYRFQELVAWQEAMDLGRRIDDAYLQLGHREEARWEVQAKHEYINMWLDKYSCAL